MKRTKKVTLTLELYLEPEEEDDPTSLPPTVELQAIFDNACQDCLQSYSLGSYWVDSPQVTQAVVEDT